MSVQNHYYNLIMDHHWEHAGYWLMQAQPFSICVCCVFIITTVSCQGMLYQIINPKPRLHSVDIY